MGPHVSFILGDFITRLYNTARCYVFIMIYILECTESEVIGLCFFKIDVNLNRVPLDIILFTIDSHDRNMH